MDMDDYEPKSIFSGSDAIAAYETIAEKATPDHLALERQCEKCLKRLGIGVSWAELYIVAHRKYPQMYGHSKWAYSAKFGKMYPEIFHSCGCLALFGFTPEKAKRLVEQSLASDSMSQAQRQELDRLNKMFRAGQ